LCFDILLAPLDSLQAALYKLYLYVYLYMPNREKMYAVFNMNLTEKANIF